MSLTGNASRRSSRALICRPDTTDGGRRTSRRFMSPVATGSSSATACAVRPGGASGGRVAVSWRTSPAGP
ncbi:hypothetical protein ACFQGW_21090 [Xanthomonas theicola]|uniref:hypothetical protein n=1 Tax=Xanthomonas theicola TaxID=56464 RepID=UPI00362047F6